MSLAWDRRGGLWIGTLASGLNRFDGEAFERFAHDPADPGSLSHDRTGVVYEDRAGRLWPVDPYSFAGDPVVHLTQDRSGRRA